MFKIDKSSIVYIDLNKNSLISRQPGISDAEAVAAAQRGEHMAGNTGRIDEDARQVREEAQRSAAEIIADARYEAGVILSKATLKYEEIKNTAWQSGYNDAQKYSKEQMEKRAQELERTMRGELEQRIGALADQYEKQLQAYEEQLSRLSLAIAKKIIHAQIEEDDEAFIDLVQRAIARFNAKEQFIIRLNDKEFDRFFAEGGEWLAERLACAPFSVRRDDALPSGGCTLESEGGILIAGADVQLEKAARILGVDPGQVEDDEF